MTLAVAKSETAARPELLREQLFQHLRQQIITGELAPGERIIELAVARQAGVSQAPVREALQRLAIEGLIIQRNHRGAVVADLSFSEMREIFEVRAVIEGQAVVHLLENMQPKYLSALRASLEEMREAAQRSDRAALIDADVRFHRSVLEFSGHTLLLRLWDVADGHVRRFLFATRDQYFRDELEVADTHQPLIDALESGSAARAVRAFEAHLHLVFARMEPVPADLTGDQP